MRKQMLIISIIKETLDAISFILLHLLLGILCFPILLFCPRYDSDSPYMDTSYHKKWFAWRPLFCIVDGKFKVIWLETVGRNFYILSYSYNYKGKAIKVF